MSDTARWALPLLDAGQAQKEMTVNEAVAALDLLASPAVEAMAADVPPAAPVAGQCWIVGGAPSGDWTGHAHSLAGWTAGGWRFVPPRNGLTVWSAADDAFATYSGGSWRTGRVTGAGLYVAGAQVVGARQSAIAAPASGSTIDTEARAAIGSILAALAAHGLIAA